MDTTQIIEFTTMDDKFLGRATIKDGQVTGSSEFVTRLIESWKKIGHSEEEFMERFANSANMAWKSELVTE
jgi:hypothetical protein